MPLIARGPFPEAIRYTGSSANKSRRLEYPMKNEIDFYTPLIGQRVRIYLLNSIKLVGMLTGECEDALFLLDVEFGVEQIVYKRAVTTAALDVG